MRIQILRLPSVVVGEDVDEPFALIIDQATETLADQTKARWQEFGVDCCALGVLVVEETVEIVDEYAQTAEPEPTPAPTVHIGEMHLPTGVDAAEYGRQLSAAMGWPKLARPGTGFSRVLDELQQGFKATRDAWESGMYLVLERGTLLLCAVDGPSLLWEPTVVDLLADDWLLASPDGDISWSDGTVV